jgi:hypothetical protein
LNESNIKKRASHDANPQRKIQQQHTPIRNGHFRQNTILVERYESLKHRLYGLIGEIGSNSAMFEYTSEAGIWIGKNPQIAK